MLQLDKLVELTFPLCLLKSDSLLHVQYVCKSQQWPQNPMISAPSYPMVAMPDIEELGQKNRGQKNVNHLSFCVRSFCPFTHT